MPVRCCPAKLPITWITWSRRPRSSSSSFNTPARSAIVFPLILLEMTARPYYRFSIELRTFKLWDFDGSSRKEYPKRRKMPTANFVDSRRKSDFGIPLRWVRPQQFPLTTCSQPAFRPSILGSVSNPPFPSALHGSPRSPQVVHNSVLDRCPFFVFSSSSMTGIGNGLLD
jgi:hypothetical protein